MKELHGASETAGCYAIAMRIVKEGHHDIGLVEWAHMFKAKIDSKHTVIDNRQFDPHRREKKQLNKLYDDYKRFCNSVVICCGANYDTVDPDVMVIFNHYRQEIRKILKRKRELREDTYRLNREHWERNTVLMQSGKKLKKDPAIPIGG